MFRFILPLLLLILVPDLYIWWQYTREQPGLWRTVLVVAPTVITLLCIVLLVCQVRVALLMQLAFLLFICIAVPKLVFVLADLIGRGVGLLIPALSRAMITRGATVLAVLMACVQIYGSAFGWQRIVTAPVPINLPGLPRGFDGYKVVQLSDLHVGTYAGDDRFLSRLVDSVNAQRPDLIVFTGDIVNTSSAELPPYLSALQRLQARDGVVSVLGNHDYCMYHPGLTPAEQAAEVRRIVEMERSMGWRVLLNEHLAIARGADTLYVAGVENTGKPPFPERGDLNKALRGVPADGFTMLLSHDPWHWRHGVLGRPVALTLSGHTHALQMQIGHFSPAQWLMREWGGLYREGRQQLYVSTGVGGSVPYRLGAWPRVEVITLRAGAHTQHLRQNPHR